jgi:hypothetical protein
MPRILQGYFATGATLRYLSVNSAWSGVFSLELPTRMTNFPGSMVHFCAGVSQ